MKQAIVHGVPASLHPELIARGATLWGLTTVVMEELQIPFNLLYVLNRFVYKVLMP